jgi:cell division septation protein DedD
MAATEDTEITLGTGKMLLLFFGLVALCAVFFSMGFSLGRSSARPALAATDASAGTTVSGGPRPSAVKPVGGPPASTDQLTFYKAVEQKDASAQMPSPAAPNSAANNAPAENSASPPSDNKPIPPDPMAALPVNGYYVQVAAVSKQEDAEALVGALKNKQYPAFSTNAAPDKLFHVQVGPFNDVKDAELMRGKLVADGYNPILKK